MLLFFFCFSFQMLMQWIPAGFMFWLTFKLKNREFLPVFLLTICSRVGMFPSVNTFIECVSPGYGAGVARLTSPTCCSSCLLLRWSGWHVGADAQWHSAVQPALLLLHVTGRRSPGTAARGRVSFAGWLRDASWYLTGCWTARLLCQITAQMSDTFSLKVIKRHFWFLNSNFFASASVSELWCFHTN